MNKAMKLCCVTLAFAFLSGTASAEVMSRAEKLRHLFLSGDTNYVFVASHCMDWRNHPENSLSGAKSAIAMGVDILEIDPAITKDGKFVLLHDAKLDRTTDGTGSAAKYTLDEICLHRLRANRGGKNAALTDERVATLDAVLLAAKDKCLVNIDKFSRHPSALLAAIKRLGMERQVICKAGGPPEKIRKKAGGEWEMIDNGTTVYMPIVCVTNETDGVEKVIGAWRREKRQPCAYEVCMVKSDGAQFFKEFRELPERPRLWVNTMWGSLNNGHTREEVKDGERAEMLWESGWGWFLKQGVTALQTDRPAALIAYLTKIGRHTLPGETVRGDIVTE